MNHHRFGKTVAMNHHGFYESSLVRKTGPMNHHIDAIYFTNKLSKINWALTHHHQYMVAALSLLESASELI